MLLCAPNYECAIFVDRDLTKFSRNLAPLKGIRRHNLLFATKLALSMKQYKILFSNFNIKIVNEIYFH